MLSTATSERLAFTVALATALATLPLLFVLAPPAWAQDHGMHHGDHGPGGWLMPPMDPNMPMLPGLEGAVPVVAPFLPGNGVDLHAVPEAVPSRAVDVADGDTIELEVAPVRRTLGGRTHLMLGYNGQYPGPLIRAARESTIFVRVTNGIELPTTVHWHGVRLDYRFDGVPGMTQDPIGFGESFTYEVRVPDAGMFWYHPHAREDVQQDLGLYGNLLVLPESPEAYGPAHREEVLVLDDLLVDDEGRLIPFGEEAPTHALMGRFGTVMLTNGVTDAHLDARPGEVVRFYLTNVANARTFNVRFGDAPVKLVGGDAGRFEREAWAETVPIAPAERYVVEARFDQPDTVAITNTIQAINHFRGEFYPRVDTLALVTVAGEPASPNLSEAWTTLRENADVVAELDPLRQHMEREPDLELATTVEIGDLPLPIVLAMEADSFYVPPMEWNDAMPMMNWLSTGSQVRWVLEDRASGLRNEEIVWSFRQGELVKVRIFNDPASFHPMNHPIHVHGQRFLILARDGVPQQNLAWKDTAILPVGSTMDLLVEMSNPGDWMLHCHISEHLHAGMMMHFTVDGVQTDEGEAARSR